MCGCEWGPVAPGPLPWDMGPLMEGVGGRMEEEEAAEEDGGLTEVLFLLTPMVYALDVGRRPGKVRKGLWCLGRGGLLPRSCGRWCKW